MNKFTLATSCLLLIYYIVYGTQQDIVVSAKEEKKIQVNLKDPEQPVFPKNYYAKGLLSLP